MKTKILMAATAVVAQLAVTTPASANPGTEGQWSGVIDLDIVTLHGMVLPDGKVLGFGSNEAGTQSGQFVYSVYDPVTNQNQVLNNTTAVNIFCANMAIDPATGDVIIAGGDMSYNGDNLPGTFGGQYSGHARVIKYDYTNPSVRPSETGDMTYERWYGSMLTLDNGELLSIGGRNSSFAGSQIPEIYNHQTGYRALNGARITDFTYGQGGLRGTYYYPYVWQASDGDVWMIEPESEGATSDIYRIDVTGNGSVQKVEKMPFKTRTLSPSMMYDVDTVLITDVDGGVWSGDLSQAIPTWEKKFQIKNENNMAQDLARTNATFVPMPDGKVAIVGGSSNAGGLSDSQFYGQASIIIWDPETNQISYTAKQQFKRLYHSIGLMLPDGRVYTAGGGAPGINRMNAEIFSPPYLFNDDGTAAARPVITAAPKNINAGETVVINVDDANQIQKVTVIKSGSATHGRTADSRVLTLDFNVIDNETISIDMPENNILSPGLWFLSTVNDQGVPASSRIMGVNMADLEEGPDLTVSDTVIYDIERDEITGPFELTITARFDEVDTRSNQTIFDFGNGAGNDNIILAQVGNSADLKFEIYDGATAYTLIAPGVIDEDQIIDWKVSVSSNGTMMIFKNGTLVAEGPGTVPNDVERTNKLVGQSSIAGNDDLLGLVRSLRLTNNGTQEPEVPPNKMPMIETELSTLTGTITENGMLPADSNDTYSVNGIVAFIDMDSTDTHTAMFAAQGDNYLGTFSVSDPIANDATTEDTAAWQFTVPHAQIAAMGQDDVAVQNYKVTITDNNGAMGMATVTVTINGSDDQVNGQPLSILPLQLTPVEINTATVFNASATGGTGALQYKWNFGDGSPDTDFSSNTSASHTYTSAGNYIVVLTVQDNTGAQTFTSSAQAVFLPRTSNQPGRSTSIAFDAASQRIWNVNPDNNTVSVIAAGTNNKLAEITVGKEPRSLSIAPDGTVWISNAGDGTVSVINGNSLSVDRTLSLGNSTAPFGIVFSPVEPVAYIAAQGSAEIVKINTDTNLMSRQLIGGNPRHLSVTADGQKLYVTHFITDRVTGEHTATPTPGITEGGEISVIDASDLSVLSSIYLASSTQQDTEASARGIANYLGAPVISPDGSTAWIPSKQDNIFKGSFRDGTNLSMDQTVRAISSKLDLSSDVELPAARVDHDDSSVASAAMFDLYGTLLFTALETSREVVVLDAPTGDELFRIETGFAPQGLALSDDGKTLYVHNFMSRSVGVYDLNDLLVKGLPSAPQIAVINTVADERLSTELLRGKQLFYDAADDRLSQGNYMSCASCHSDGGHDGRVWDMTGFGEGLRNTISLQGRGADGHGALHWSGNFDEVQDFESQIRALAGGTGLMNDTDFEATKAPLGTAKAGLSTELDALAAYVNSLTETDFSPHRNADGSLTSAGKLGRDLFTEKGCASCHAGDTFTDSDTGVLHDIGTLSAASGQRLNGALSGIDTPSLLGVWSTAPYLHDGSAATLDAAVRAHNNLNVSDNEVQNLVAYLKQIDSNEPSVTTDPDVPPGTFSNQAATAIKLDGGLADWDNYTSFGDDADDIPASETLDWREAWMAHDTGYFYLAMQNEVAIEPSWGQTVYIDTDGNPATGFNNGMPLGADYVIQGRFAYRYSGEGTNWQWEFMQMLDGTWQQGAFEYRIPRELLDNATTLELGFVGSNAPYGGNSEDVYPNDFYNSASDNRTFTYTAQLASNSVPEVNDQTFRVQPGVQLNISLAASDFDNDTLSYTLLTQPAAGDLSGTAPELIYMAPSDFEGGVQFSYQVNDGTADSAVATVQIDVVAEGATFANNPLSGITVDGRLTEWNSAQAFVEDPADTLSDINPIDYRRAWLAHDNTHFYLAYEIEQRDAASIDSWGFNTYIDTDRDRTTGYVGTEAIGTEYLLQGDYLYQYSGDGTSWAWTAVGGVERALNGNIAEIGLPRNALGNPAEFDLIFIGDNLSVNGGQGLTLDLYPDSIYDPNSEPRYFSYTTGGILAFDGTNPTLLAALAPETPYNGTLALQNNPVQPDHYVSNSGGGSMGGLSILALSLLGLVRRNPNWLT